MLKTRKRWNSRENIYISFRAFFETNIDLYNMEKYETRIFIFHKILSEI